MPSIATQNKPKAKPQSMVSQGKRTAINGVTKAPRNISATAAAAKRTLTCCSPRALAPDPEPQSNRKKPPRKLEIRSQSYNVNAIRLSAPFLDDLLAKMLQLQNRMLMTGQDIAASSETEDIIKRE